MAACMPRRPTWGLPSVAVAPPSLVLIWGSSALASLPPLGLFKAEVGMRCCTIVLLTTNLCDGLWEPEGVDSDMMLLRIEF